MGARLPGQQKENGDGAAPAGDGHWVKIDLFDHQSAQALEEGGHYQQQQGVSALHVHPRFCAVKKELCAYRLGMSIELCIGAWLSDGWFPAARDGAL
jgi:hypothetical protein